MNETARAAMAISLVGLDRDELAEVLAEVGEPSPSRRMRANQLFHWIYYRGARSLADMTSVPGALREALAERFSLFRGAVARTEESADGTTKWLVRLDAGALIETVHIPAEDRGALCLSSQVGCTLNCSFCHTGTQRLVRNLRAGEIVGQVLMARDALDEWPSSAGTRRVSSLVMMGMGEPLYNYENVAKALRLAMDDAGIAIARRRITLSTAGVVPEIVRCGSELGVNLAVSLHAVEDGLRDTLVPLNRKYPLAELMAAVRAYPAGRNSRRITFEYVMLKGINDSSAGCARAHPPHPRHPGQGQPDPVQPLARGALRVLGEYRHPPLRPDRQRRRLRGPGPHPARPRHLGRVRPAALGLGQAAPAHAGGHGGRALVRVVGLFAVEDALHRREVVVGQRLHPVDLATGTWLRSRRARGVAAGRSRAPAPAPGRRARGSRGRRRLARPWGRSPSPRDSP